MKYAPTKASFRISICDANAAPVVGPIPDTICTSPGGKRPQSLMICARRQQVSGAFSEDLRITAFPAASAAAMCATARMRGLFHGMITAHTP